MNDTNVSSMGNRTRKMTPSTAFKNTAIETRTTLFEKYYGKEELWSKRKNRRL